LTVIRVGETHHPDRGIGTCLGCISRLRPSD